ncbi:hypothetical protein AB0941_39400 [Streptomyces sp. NPDC013433]|uniref:hypothetical protein n=1 Tax=Streptomyces sp. NPDC013433 TaxID=3155604 RepID=UPI0034515FE3
MAAGEGRVTYDTGYGGRKTLIAAAAHHGAQCRPPGGGLPGRRLEDRFVELVAGRLSRDEADRWAARWVVEDGIVWDDLSWWALNLLYGIDLPAGESGGYLHDGEQVRAWLAELKERRAMS